MVNTDMSVVSSPRVARVVVAAPFMAALVVTLWSGAAAQAPPGWPRTLPDGQPDVQGYWAAVSNEGGGMGLILEAPAGTKRRGLVVDPADGQIPYLPWARQRRDEVQEHHLHPNPAQIDTATRAWPDSLPRISYYGIHPFQILQLRGEVVILYEKQHEFRYIPLDGRRQPDDSVKLWMGSSRGRWEGTTLVVDVTNLTDRIRFSVVGDFASDKVRLTERWQFTDANTIRLAVTFDDPQVFSRPWTVVKTIKRVTEPGFEIMEYAGVEGEKDSHLMVDIPAALKEKK